MACLPACLAARLALCKTADLADMAFFPSAAGDAAMIVVAVQRTSHRRHLDAAAAARSLDRRFYLVNCAREHERLATPPPFVRENGQRAYRERQSAGNLLCIPRDEKYKFPI